MSVHHLWRRPVSLDRPSETPVSIITQILEAWDKADAETRKSVLMYLQTQIDVKRGE